MLGTRVALLLICSLGIAHAEAPAKMKPAPDPSCSRDEDLTGTYKADLHTKKSPTWEAKKVLQCFPKGNDLAVNIKVTANKPGAATPYTVTAIKNDAKLDAFEILRMVTPACKSQGATKERVVGMSWTETWKTKWKDKGYVTWDHMVGILKLADGTTRVRVETTLIGPTDDVECYALFQ